MALIPAEPLQRKALGVGLGALALFYLFHSFWYSGQRAEVVSMEDRLETLEQQNRAAQITAARGGGQIEERLAAYERHVMTLEELIPASGEVPALLREITSQARQIIGSDPARFRPEPDEPGEFYTLKAYQMQAIGDYHDIARFLTAVASLSRIISPVDVAITTFADPQGVSNAENPVTADFRIETYILPQTAERLPPAQIGGG
jgi:type IV pilus assembly protein PilO